MAVALLLPNAPEQLPAGLDPSSLTRLSDSGTQSPDWLLGSDQTPVLDWLQAIQCFPEAIRLCHRADAGWWNLATQAPWEAPSPEPAPAAQPSAEAAPQPAAKEPVRPLSHMKDSELIRQTFLRSAWGLGKPENLRLVEDYEEEAWERIGRNPTLPDRLFRARLNGEQAEQLAGEVDQRLQQGEPADQVEAWVRAACANLDAWVLKHALKTLEKQSNYYQSRQKRQTPGEWHSTLEHVQLRNGHHPNSLRHLPPSPAWDIYIDETGSVFDEQADGIQPSAQELGRVVALAIPQGTTLPSLPRRFHANTSSTSEVDAALRSLLGARVGIFGFSVQDPASRARYWIGHVEQLARWVLLQLPLEPGQPCSVTVRIEQNRGYKVRDSLRALQEILEGECRRLAPERFAGLRLALQFMDKSEPLNGYVDAVAFTWGSRSAACRDRLKKSALLGHCLLNPDHRALERLYLALNTQKKLTPTDWFDLCDAAAREPAGGLLRHFLEQLGAQVRQQPGQWQAFLDEVRQRLRLKQFHLDSLGHALDWLERYAPEGHTLPAAQRLPLETARLAAGNHRGLVDLPRIQRCLQLMQQLRDEQPAEACEALLRLAVSTANAFEFEALRGAVEQWLGEPIAVPGLLNHAKLHSTLGQLEALGGQPQAALAHFDRALESFARLSDPQQAAREAAQTRTYRLIAEMDRPDADPAALIEALREHLHTLIGKAEDGEISRSLAYTGQAQRYAHHLWLRALVRWPEVLRVARAEYLGQRHQWQSHEDHPWPLIEAYRGWLLADADQPGPASEHFALAIERCADMDNGPTLHWMAEVLRCLAQALGVGLAERPSAETRTRLLQQLPHAPHAALERFAHAGAPEHAGLLASLEQCLPFNFH